uniref:ectonucleotide pyrophosphatase/phosphodiesterase family member 7-like isoform X1 n=1 Tax=Styela clava TaxID=7725 RepID=UPI0019397C8B|nr:ectonucleotide pyrophosphatase/phosphodiesterase family member 7-like isoform X1 [Styela clava]
MNVAIRFLAIIFGLIVSIRAAPILVNAGPARREHHKLLLISFDCLKWSYFDRTKEMPGFKFLSENGVRAEYMKPAFPSHTSPCHTTIATGLYPESHGVVHNCVYDQHNDSTGQTDFYGALAVNDWWDNGQEPIWITASSQGLKSGGYMYPGSNATNDGRTATRSILELRTTSYNEEAWRKRIDDVMSWFSDDDFDFIALYFEQPDIDSHAFGPDSDRVDDVTLPLVDRTIQYLFNQSDNYGLFDDLNIIITSDHGMLNVNTSARDNDTISLMRYVDPSWVSFQFSYGPLGLIEPVPENKTAVYEGLKAGSNRMEVYYKEEIPERYHYKNNDRVPSIVITAHHGYEVYEYFPGVHTYRGNHGYDNDFEDMRTSYFSIGPSFKKGVTVDGFESVNIYPLMCHLLGLTPAPNNGSLEVLYPTLASDPVTSTQSEMTTSGGVSIVHYNTVIFLLSLFSAHIFTFI